MSSRKFSTVCANFEAEVEAHGRDDEVVEKDIATVGAAARREVVEINFSAMVADLIIEG